MYFSLRTVICRTLEGEQNEENIYKRLKYNANIILRRLS